MEETQVLQMPSILSDRFGRKIDYLRISVTDRCNLRCVYCMPPEGIELFEKNEILTFEEMERFSRVAINLGVRKIKLTGGEPLVRKGIVDFIASLSKIEVFELIEFGKEKGIEVRFIEFMPLCGNGWNRDYFIPLVDVKKKIEQMYKLTNLKNDGVADRYSIDGGGIVGFITTISEPFCSSCSRLRLTARGTLRPCLFSTLEINVFPLLRKVAPDEEIEKAIRRAVYVKPEWNPVLSGVEDPKKVFIRNIGG